VLGLPLKLLLKAWIELIRILNIRRGVTLLLLMDFILIEKVGEVTLKGQVDEEV
jgi:hypothetical protein